MPSITPCPLPADALLRRYQRDDAYADCYGTEVAFRVSQAQFVEAFYTTWIFRIERQLLAWFAARPSTDEEAHRLASGAIDSFAAWRVESRSADQLLLRDDTGRTRSWLMRTPAEASQTATRLYFGSAVVAKRNAPPGEADLGVVFRALLGFHRLYSRALLSAARSRLQALDAAARADG